MTALACSPFHYLSPCLFWQSVVKDLGHRTFLLCCIQKTIAGLHLAINKHAAQGHRMCLIMLHASYCAMSWKVASLTSRDTSSLQSARYSLALVPMRRVRMRHSTYYRPVNFPFAHVTCSQKPSQLTTLYIYSVAFSVLLPPKLLVAPSISLLSDSRDGCMPMSHSTFEQ